MGSLVYNDADGIERSITIGVEPVLIGRAPECGIRSNDPRVSRTHARFYVDQLGTLYIEDLGSSNGVFIGPHRVQCGAVPIGELVIVGSLTFRRLPASDVHELLEVERKARVAAEQERDAYGVRMSELHHELRAVREEHVSAQASRADGRLAEYQQRLDELFAERTKTSVELAGAKERISRLEAQLAASSSPVETLAAELESYRERLADMDEQVKSAEVRLRSAEEELAVARADVTSAEERLVSEVAATEARANTELASRVDELAIARTDLEKAEERILDLSRKVSELEERLAQVTGRF